VRTYLALLLIVLFSTQFDPVPKKFPTYEDLWVSKETLMTLARHHGTMALKITEEEAFIWRNARWISVLKRNKS
jgi:hypothetical protein